ncbi:MAG: HAMP domain-containing protein [Lachnospiraceae bacterium]|nr:HAMP domain-containing protein [Lachnospiraceae bacterium]
MREKIKSSLFAKVFFITAAMLLCISLLVYALLAWLMPRTYSGRLNAVLDEQTQVFLSELEETAFLDSGGLFEQFLKNTDIYSVELFDEDGRQVPIPAGHQEAVLEEAAMTAVYESYDSDSVLSNSYYFSFSDSHGVYMLMVYGKAEQVAEIRQAFRHILPLLLFVILAVSFGASWLYSRLITKPVLEISRISEEMSGLHLDWQIDIRRTDELGTLGRSLNSLSRNLSAALSGLKDANKKLEEDIEREKKLEQARTDFFSAVSHELKTPVTVIKGQLEGMLLGIGAYKDHEKYLARSLETANTLESMVQEILTISRLDTIGADFKRDQFDCVQVIRNYLNETEDLIAGKDLQVSMELPPFVWINGNKMLMEKVFSNLIGNAVKYSPPGAAIRICGHMECERFHFSVENTGTRIPDESIPKLFDAFYRVEQSRNRKTGGSGLGLYVTQRILRRHGSECGVCNTDSGVRFSFTMATA